MNRRRVATFGAAALFVAAIVGAAIVAGRGGGSGPAERSAALTKLPGPGSATESSAAAGSASGGGTAVAHPISPVEYVVKGTLPVLPTTAPAYRLAGTTQSSDASRLAAAFGLRGPVNADSDGFAVVDGNRRLVMARNAVSGWFYSDDPANAGCPATGGCATASGSGVAVPACPPQPCPPEHMCAASCSAVPTPPPAKPADLPTKERAQQIATGLMTKLGVDLTGARIDVQDRFDAWAVEAAPAVAGLPVLGYSTSVTVGVKGAVVAASGHVAGMTKIGDYPLAGTDAGLARLRSGMAGFFGGPRPMLATTAPGVAKVIPGDAGNTASDGTGPDGRPLGSGAPPGAPPGPPARALPPVSATPQPAPIPDVCLAKFHGPCPPTTLPATPPPPSPEPPVRTVTITGVHLALVFVPSFDPSKPATLEPAYVFETDGSGDLPPVAAVVDRLLDPPPGTPPTTVPGGPAPGRPTPAPAPAPAPTPTPNP